MRGRLRVSSVDVVVSASLVMLTHSKGETSCSSNLVCSMLFFGEALAVSAAIGVLEQHEQQDEVDPVAAAEDDGFVVAVVVVVVAVAFVVVVVFAVVVVVFAVVVVVFAVVVVVVAIVVAAKFVL